MRNPRPIISFTFDDFPASAYTSTAPLFRDAGVHATFFTSLGLLGRVAPTGVIASHDLFREVLASPHEVACHTYDHFDAFETPFFSYRASVERNLRELRTFDPVATFVTHSFPINFPGVRTKRFVGRRFLASRAGGQTHNQETLDLPYLQSFFIERSRSNPDAMREQIARAVQANGWLIFSTHDVCDQPTDYGCTPALFAKVLQWSIDSGAEILSVREALSACGVAAPSSVPGSRSL